MASPEATLNVPAAHAEQGPPSGPVYPAEHKLQSAAAFDPVPAVVLPTSQLLLKGEIHVLVESL